MITALADLAFMFIFIPKHGLNGAALAYLLSAFPVLGFLYFIEHKYFASSKKEIWFFYGKLFIKIATVSFVGFLLGELLLRPLVHNLWQAVIIGGFNYVLYLLSFWLFGFMAPEDKLLVKQYSQKFLLYFRITRAV